MPQVGGFYISHPDIERKYKVTFIVEMEIEVEAEDEDYALCLAENTYNDGHLEEFEKKVVGERVETEEPRKNRGEKARKKLKQMERM
jgi:hypothetical protein